MKKLDRFILFSFIGPFLMILVVVIFILMLHFLWLYIDELVGKGLGLKIILEFLMWGSCTILPLALPLSTLLASMMTLGQMGENSELVALKASGISLTRLMTPLMICSIFSSSLIGFSCRLKRECLQKTTWVSRKEKTIKEFFHFAESPAMSFCFIHAPNAS